MFLRFFRHRTETRLQSICRVLEIIIPRCCSRIKQSTQQPSDENETEENGNTLDVQDADGNPSANINSCEHGLVKVSTLTTGTFQDGSVHLTTATLE